MTKTPILATLDDDLNFSPFCGRVPVASFHWLIFMTKIVEHAARWWKSWIAKMTNSLNIFWVNFIMMCLHCHVWNDFFLGPPVRSEHFRPLTKRMVSRPALGPVFCQARKVSQAFHQAKMRSENVGPGEESIWYEYLWEFLKRINLDI